MSDGVQLDIPFVVVVVDNRQMGEDKYLSRQAGPRQIYKHQIQENFETFDDFFVKKASRSLHF